MKYPDPPAVEQHNNTIALILSCNKMWKPKSGVFFLFLFQETVEVQMLEMAEVPAHSEGTVLDPLDVRLFCLKIRAGRDN